MAGPAQDPNSISINDADTRLGILVVTLPRHRRLFEFLPALGAWRLRSSPWQDDGVAEAEESRGSFGGSCEYAVAGILLLLQGHVHRHTHTYGHTLMYISPLLKALFLVDSEYKDFTTSHIP